MLGYDLLWPTHPGGGFFVFDGGRSSLRRQGGLHEPYSTIHPFASDAGRLSAWRGGLAFDHARTHLRPRHASWGILMVHHVDHRPGRRRGDLRNRDVGRHLFPDDLNRLDHDPVRSGRGRVGFGRFGKRRRRLDDVLGFRERVAGHLDLDGKLDRNGLHLDRRDGQFVRPRVAAHQQKRHHRHHPEALSCSCSSIHGSSPCPFSLCLCLQTRADPER